VHSPRHISHSKAQLHLQLSRYRDPWFPRPYLAVGVGAMLECEILREMQESFVYRSLFQWEADLALADLVAKG
jgi:hypothetical protein